MIFIVISFGNQYLNQTRGNVARVAEEKSKFRKPLNELVQTRGIIPFSPNMSDNSFRIMESVSSYLTKKKGLTMLCYFIKREQGSV